MTLSTETTGMAAALSPLAQRLCRLVSIRSISRDEAAIADAVEQELLQNEFTPTRQGHNVWIEFGDRPRPRLLFNSHLDTVPPGAGWSTDPWTPRITQDCIFGLGSNDAKGCVSAIIEAAISLRRTLSAGQALGGTIVVALTAEEENSGAGLSTIVERLRPIDAAIVGEPTGLTPMTAQRGLLILKATAHGRSAHPANTPMETEQNAIFNAAAAIQSLRQFDWGAPHPLLGRCHAHVTQISGGVARNVVPDACEFWIDIRTTPLESHSALVNRLRAALNCDIQVHSDRLTPFNTADEQPIVRAVLSALPGSAPRGSHAMSDMVFLTSVPAVKIGPGQSPRSHTPDEYIRLEELSAGATAYEQIARAYFREISHG